MHLRIFKEIDKRQKFLFVIFMVLLILFSVFLFLRSYAIYEEKNQFHIISGNVPDQNYDLKFSFLLENEGESTFLNEIPKDKKYLVSISCNHDAVGVWDYESWGPLITNINQTQTKCNITFSTSYPLEKYGIHERLTRTETGLYEVSHEDAEITYTDDANARNLLKQKEYRYAGSNPDNYVWFNEELWRIIGLVNTPEGQRIKIIRNESIGTFSWDSSELNINSGLGVNEWRQSKLMNLLNHGAYYNREAGECYKGIGNAKVSCDFRDVGLRNEAKEMIDMVTWNLGSNGRDDFLLINADQFYDFERSNNIGKMCSGNLCNDNVTRTTTWVGQVGLMYPSDYGYATSGSNTTIREFCLNTLLSNWNDRSVNECRNYDWLYTSTQGMWTLMPLVDWESAINVFNVNGDVSVSRVSNERTIYPAVYLKSSIRFINGVGTSDNPYFLS